MARYNTWRLVRKLRRAERIGNVILCDTKGIELKPQQVFGENGFQDGYIPVGYKPPFLVIATPETMLVSFFTPYPEQ